MAMQDERIAPDLDLSEQTQITFRYMGRDADEGRLDASDLVQAVDGIWQLLALHAHYFTTGRVPDDIVSQGKHYSVDFVAARKGSVMVEFLVTVTGGLTVIGVHELCRHYGTFIMESVRELLDDESGSGRIHELLKHYPPQFQKKAQELLKRAGRPIGRSASQAQIIVDGSHVAEIDAKQLWRAGVRVKCGQAVGEVSMRFPTDDRQALYQSKIAEFVEMQKLSPVPGMPMRVRDFELN